MADIVEAADWPDESAGSGCDRALDRPETGSAFDGGQRPFVGFFRGSHPLASLFAATASPLT